MEYTTFSVSKILEIKRERLREWYVRGFIPPGDTSTGKRLWTKDEVYHIAIFMFLIDSGGMRRGVAKGIADRCIVYGREVPIVFYNNRIETSVHVDKIDNYVNGRIARIERGGN